MKDSNKEISATFKLTKLAKISIIFAVSPLVILFTLGIGEVVINEIFGNRECWFKDEYLDLDFSGTIKAKGFDPKNHNTPFIDIMTSNKLNEHIFLDFKEDQLWDKLELKDQISKQKGTLDFKITRDTITSILTPSFNCRTGDFWLKFI